ncbi:MAG: LLM class F420-dependent oxidoreductase [Anaerolineae bacterium]
MEFGAVFPQTEFGHDPQAVKDYAQMLEAVGLQYVDVYDHILGVNPERPGGWRGPYTYQSAFLEPFVLYAYMAAVTTRLTLATNIIILPQRQTALVAKQAATLDVLSNGRLRLGVGLGWNDVEYTALNENFKNRARRIEEQVVLLRTLWTEPLVTLNGKYHTIPDAGLNPLPVQRPIPIWFGGSANEALKRIARLADGWMINVRKPEEAKPLVEQFKRYLQEAGRDPNRFPLEARISYGDGRPETWQALAGEWQALGVTYLSFNSMGARLQTPAAHMDAVRQFAAAFNKP